MGQFRLFVESLAFFFAIQLTITLTSTSSAWANPKVPVDPRAYRHLLKQFIFESKSFDGRGEPSQGGVADAESSLAPLGKASGEDSRQAAKPAVAIESGPLVMGFPLYDQLDKSGRPIEICSEAAMKRELTRNACQLALASALQRALEMGEMPRALAQGVAAALSSSLNPRTGSGSDSAVTSGVITLYSTGAADGPDPEGSAVTVRLALFRNKGDQRTALFTAEKKF